MQCAACRAVFSDALDVCPRCKRPAPPPVTPSEKTSAEKRSPTTSHAESRVSNTSTRASARAANGVTSESSATRQSAVMVADETTENEVNPTETPTPPAASTLIEFPVAGRAPRPQWRKDLSERVREIKMRRAREATPEGEDLPAHDQAAPNTHGDAPRAADDAASASPLGLVPSRPTEQTELNPLVAAALRRIERARHPVPSPNVKRASKGGGAAAAVARVAEEDYHPGVETAMPHAAASKHSRHASTASNTSANETHTAHDATHMNSSEAMATEEKQGEGARAAGLVLISTQPTVQVRTENYETDGSEAVEARSQIVAPPNAMVAGESVVVEPIKTSVASAQAESLVPHGAPAAVATTHMRVEDKAPARRVIDESTLDRLEAQMFATTGVAHAVESFDDRAPRHVRLFGNLADLLLVAFFASPFAAIIELTSGAWTDPRVAASMGGVLLVVMFVYFTGSTGLAGRTWGMSLFSLRVIDARTALAPTTGQCVRRTLAYMLSLPLLCAGILYSLFDAEGRTLHDHLSGTIVVRN